MPVKAPPAPMPAPVYNWTGWYVGVNAGASFGNVKTDFNAPLNVSGTDSRFPGVTVMGPFGFAGSDRTYPNGFMGGGQIGYNWQYSALIVLGVEADFQGALERDSSPTFTNIISGTIGGPLPPELTVNGSSVLNYQTKIDWFGTARVRIGYVWGNGEVMSYVTGGLAYGKVDVEGTSTVNSLVAPIPLPAITQAFGHNAINTGWVVGYGTEGVINFWGSRNWTWKIEGLYMDLGTLDAVGLGGSSTNTFPGVSATATAGPVTTHSHFTDGILRAGLNYKFY
jgi:outer membrane immunogenic protein